MVKDAIGIIDLGLEGFQIAKTISENLKHERIVYINDLEYESYLNISDNELIKIIKRNIALLLENNLKLLIVVSDMIVDRAASLLLDLKVPSVNIIETLVNYANLNYEQKNFILLAKEEILRANLYQKNIKYNRLYNIASDELEAVIRDKMVKTSRSFYTIRENFKSVLKKEIDLIITSTPNLVKLKIEMKEYLNFEEITDLGEILLNRLKHEKLVELNIKGRGVFFVYSTLPKKEFRKLVAVNKFKYKQIKNEKESGKVNG
jgi:glutamate racemase